MKLFRDDRGQMLILTALSMTVLFGFLAFATDVGLMFRSRRNLQIAADAAATAGALNLHYGSTSGQAAQGAYCAAYANGYKGTNITYTCNNTVISNFTNATIALNSAPVYGYHESAGFYEAILTESNPTMFANMLGIHSANISARAVAGTVGHSHDCVWLMNPTGTDLLLQGSATITAANATTTCSIYVNSTDPNSISVTGGGNVINAAYVNTAGGPSSLNDTTIGRGTATVYTGALPESAPDIPTAGPPLSQCNSGNTFSQTSQLPTNKTIDATVLDPVNNVVCFGPPLANPDMSGYTMNNGVFLFENGVTIGSGSNTNMNSATLDVYGGSLTMGTNSYLSAKTAGPYNGISILVPATNLTYPANTPCKKNGSSPPELTLQFGSGSSKLDGLIVAPNATIVMHDQGGSIIGTGIYAGSLCSYPGTLILPNYSDAHPTTTPLKIVALVE
jgi:Flp pilus assembly protein TadG